ncbi:MAG: hypothetical protein VW270_21365 [Candidatus Poseidoniales archaeon]
MTNKKPVLYRELASTSSPPASPREAVERLVADIEKTKGDILTDQKFLKNLISKCLEHPDVFVRERKGEVSAAERKIKRHSLKGRTNKVKFNCYLSDEEVEQLQSLVEHRGDRSPSDLVNQVICTALATLRII